MSKVILLGISNLKGGLMKEMESVDAIPHIVLNFGRFNMDRGLNLENNKEGNRQNTICSA